MTMAPTTYTPQSLIAYRAVAETYGVEIAEMLVEFTVSAVLEPLVESETTRRTKAADRAGGKPSICTVGRLF